MSQRTRNVEQISERSHISDLSDHTRWELGCQVNEEDGGKSLWRWLAKELGLDNEDTERIRSNPNPGYEVIRCWSKRSDSTIRVLKHVFRDVFKRKDLVDFIDKARQSKLVYNVIF